ncbi:MAG: hypothetical protein J3K34DRAFT_430665 [Monoraphidium minutum]|nr:MAG: hypothetical protein J3K34DRAFT_430665 [Monoraphidium minutum]
MSFEVTTATSLPAFRCPQVTVRRRFKDVVALSRLLDGLLPGAILPARPERNFVEGRLRMAPPFVEQRRAAMERYLNRLAAHPEVARSEALRVWLEADGTLRSAPAWLALNPKAPTPAQATVRLVRTLTGMQRAAPTPAEAARPPGASRDVYRLLHERYAAMRGVMAGAEGRPEEARLRDQGALVEDLSEALRAAAGRADAWAAASGDLAAIWGDLAAALEGLSTFEATYGSVGAQPTVALATAARACGATKALGGDAAAALSAALQPLRDHAAAMPNAARALAARERQLLTSLTLQRDLDAARARLQQVQLSPGTKGKKLEELRQQVASLEASQASAAAEYERLAGRNADELAALKAARGGELAGAVAHLARVALSHEEQAAAGWQATTTALPTMQGGPVTAYMAQRYFKP